MSTLGRFRTAVDVAMTTLPTPRRLLLDILASTSSVDPGLRASTYEARVTGTGIDNEVTVHLTQPERMAERRAFGLTLTDDQRAKLNQRERTDVRAVAEASEQWMVAIATLLAEALDEGCPDMDDYAWDEAVKDAHLLLEHGRGETLKAAIDVDRPVAQPMREATRAIRRLLAVHHRYNPHAADAWTRYREAGGRIDEICDIHASLDPPIFKPKHGKDNLCKTCADLRRTAGERPPVALIALLERGSQVEYRNARARWLDERGVQAAS